jgi:hypothetical protein
VAGITPYLSITTVKVNGLNSPIKKKHKLVDLIIKYDPIICCQQKMNFTNKDKHMLKEEEREKIS